MPFDNGIASPNPVTGDGTAAAAAALPDQQAGNGSALPYARLVAQFLACCLLISIGIFTVAHCVSRRQYGAVAAGVAAFCIAAAVMVAQSTTYDWNRLKLGQLGATVSRLHSRLLRTAMIICALFCVSAGMLGTTIGRRGAQTAALIDDLARMSELATRISNARAGADTTIPAQLAMYKEIEPDVSRWQSLLQRVKMELSAYDDRFPSQHAQTVQSLGNIEGGLRQADLLKQQIAVAKQIERLDAGEREAEWDKKMMRLLIKDQTEEAIK